MGALFVHFNVRINKWRKEKLGPSKVKRLIEIVILITITTLVFFLLSFAFPCRDTANIIWVKDEVCDTGTEPAIVQFRCGNNTYSDMASLMFTTPSNALRLLYDRNRHVFSLGSLAVFTVVYFILSTITSGAYVASGIFIPMMLIGGALGRLAGNLVELSMTTAIDASIYSVVGSAAAMAGSLRMTISLVVIIVELTEGTQYLLPIILVVMVGKWTGDVFNEGIYEHLIELKRIPFLPSHPASSTRSLTVTNEMAREVVTVPTLLKVSDALRILKETRHNGFPVVLPDSRNVVCGIILRSQLLILLDKRVFGYEEDFPSKELLATELIWGDLGSPKSGNYLTHKEFVQNLAKKSPEMKTLCITRDEEDCYIDLRPYMNLSVITVSKWFSFTEAFTLFRSQGLRHLVVVNAHNEVEGMLTRKDFL